MRKAIVAAVLGILFVPSHVLAAGDADAIQVNPVPLDPLAAALAATANELLTALRDILPELVAVCTGLGALLLWLGPRLGNPQWRWTGYLLCAGSVMLYSFVALWPLALYFMNRTGLVGGNIP